VVRDRDGAVAPRGGLFDGGGCVGQSVHGGHRRVQVQLDTLVGRCILSHGCRQAKNRVRLHDRLVFVAVEGHLALDAHPHAGLDAAQDGLGLVGLHELAHAHGARVVGHVELDDPGVAFFELAVVDGEDLALDHDAEHVERELLDGRDGAVERSAVDPVPVWRSRCAA